MAAVSSSLRRSLGSGKFSGVEVDESARNDAKVFAVLDAVGATVGTLCRGEVEDANEADVAGCGCDCGGMKVNEVDGEPKPVKPPNFGAALRS